MLEQIDFEYFSIVICDNTAAFPSTVYRETLTKEKFDEFDKSWPIRQTKTIQYKATIYF